jgi:hypothetical protein
MNVLDMLKQDGTVTLAAITGTIRTTFVHVVYDAIRNGAAETGVIVLTADAPDSVRAETLERLGGDESLMLVCDERFSKGKRKGENKDARAILLGLQRVNGANPSRAEDAETLGSVRVPVESGIPNDSGEIVGFAVIPANPVEVAGK